MSRSRVAQAAGFFALALLAIGSALYAINAPQRVLTNVLLIAGAALLVVYIILNFAVIGVFLRSRSSRYGANMLVMIVLYTTIVIIVQALAVRHSYRYDLTRNKRFSLAGQTINVLQGLPGDLPRD